MNYIKRHWHGDLGLAQSFWVNFVLINILLLFIETWVGRASGIEDPILASRIAIGHLFIRLAVIYPWQIVGVWRSADKHTKKTGKALASGLVKIFIVLGLISTIGKVSTNWPLYKNFFQMNFERANYEVKVINDGEILHFTGEMGFGVSAEVENTIENNPGIDGIILDSNGGRIYVGRELSKIIDKYNLDTYTLEGCFSACTTAFIGGQRRYLAKGANLGFHQYRAYNEEIAKYFDSKAEQRKDKRIFLKKGVKEVFVKKMFEAKGEALWYPTIDVMLKNNVIHKVINPYDLTLVQYPEEVREKIEKILSDFPLFAYLKEKEPKTYNRLLSDLKRHIEKGASGVEIQQIGARYALRIAEKYLPRTSDKALLNFFKSNVDILENLNKRSPIMCLKHLFPEQYGNLNTSETLTEKQIMDLHDRYVAVLQESGDNKVENIDREKAEKVVDQVMTDLGEDIKYLDPQSLQNKQEYSACCQAFINFYDSIMRHNDKIAANTLRYLFLPQNQDNHETLQSTSTEDKKTKYAHTSINIRSGPSTDYKIVTTIHKGDSLKIGLVQNGWAKAYINGQEIGYIYAKLLKDIPPERKPAVEIKSWDWSLDESYGKNGILIWKATFKNNTDKYIDKIECKFSTYNKKGTHIDSQTINVHNLPPQETLTKRGSADSLGSEYKASFQVVEVYH